MAKSSRIEKRLMGEFGDLESVIPHMVSRVGQEETARKLRVKQAWVSRWLGRNGYVKKIHWVKDTQGGHHEPA